jgi:hypothetical protein
MADCTIAIVTKNAKADRESLPDQPQVESGSPSDLLAVLIPAASDVVNAEEFNVLVTATSAGRNVPPVVPKHCPAILAAPGGRTLLDAVGIASVVASDLLPYLVGVSGTVLARRGRQARATPHRKTVRAPAVPAEVVGQFARPAAGAEKRLGRERGFRGVCRSPSFQGSVPARTTGIREPVTVSRFTMECRQRLHLPARETLLRKSHATIVPQKPTKTSSVVGIFAATYEPADEGQT